MKNPYLVRALYFALGVVVGSMLSCGNDGLNGKTDFPADPDRPAIQVPAGADGANGTNGMDGAAGTNGTPGGSCHVEQLDNGARIFCDDGSEAIVHNGLDGQDCRHNHGRNSR